MINTNNDELTFKKDVDLYVGKKAIVVEALDDYGDVLQTKKIRILRLATFKDVKDDYWAVEPIQYLSTAGIIEGYMDGRFMPNRVLTRAELATVLVRAKNEDIDLTLQKRIFPDLPASHWADRYIEAARGIGLVVGYPNSNFMPNNEISRIEGVTVATRFDGEQIEVPTKESYKDISKKHWGLKYVESAKDNGLLDYLSTKRFNPKTGLSRAEAIELLSKTQYGENIIADLLNWNKGYGTVESKEIASISIAYREIMKSIKAELLLPQNAMIEYKVQIGAYPSKEVAVKKAFNLYEKGFNTFVREIDGLWVLRTGSFYSNVQAEKQMNELRSKGVSSKLLAQCPVEYKLQLGTHQTKDKAIEEAKLLVNEGIKSFKIIAYVFIY